MNNNYKKNLTAIAAVVTVGIVGYTLLSQHATVKHVQEMYPEIEKSIAKKACWTVFKKALLGQYQNVDISNATEAQMDELFLQEVAKIQSKK